MFVHIKIREEPVENISNAKLTIGPLEYLILGALEMSTWEDLSAST